MTTSEEAVVPVLRARAVRVEVPGPRSRVLRRSAGSIRALVGLDLQVRAGDIVWIVGETAAGANAVGRVLGGELAPSAGAVELLGRDLTTLSGRRHARARRHLAWLDAQAEATLDPKRTAAEAVAEAAAGSARSVTRDHLARAHDLLGELGLSADAWDSRPVALSSTDRQLVAAARVVALRPRVLVYRPAGRSAPEADPVWVALTGLRREASTALVVVGLGLPNSMGPQERAVVLCGGRVVEVLGHGDLQHPLHPYTMMLRRGDSGPASDATTAPGGSSSSVRAGEEGCPFRRDCPRAKDRCSTEVPRLSRPLGATHDVACHFPEDPRPPHDRGPAAGGGARVAGLGSAAEAPSRSDEPTAREFAEG